MYKKIQNKFNPTSGQRYGGQKHITSNCFKYKKQELNIPCSTNSLCTAELVNQPPPFVES